MRQCSGIRRSGERCTQTVEPPNAYCWHHAPERAQERRRAASKAGRSRPSTEVRVIKEEIKSVISDVKAGELDRNDAAVMIQGYRALKDFLARRWGLARWRIKKHRDECLVGERRAGVEADLRRMAGMAEGMAEGEGRGVHR